jgi:hypothetical protein
MNGQHHRGCSAEWFFGKPGGQNASGRTCAYHDEIAIGHSLTCSDRVEIVMIVIGL